MALFRYQATPSLNHSNETTWDAGAVDGYPWLFVGSLSAAESHEDLRKNNVSHVLSVARKLPIKTFPKNIQNIRVEIDDHPSANFLHVVSQCVEFLDSVHSSSTTTTTARGQQEEEQEQQQQHGSVVLVHCASGVSRSVTAIIAWLMISGKTCYSFEEALSAVRVNRPQANPNAGFVSQMQILEKHNGCLKEAIEDWKSHNTLDMMGRVATRRRLANETHAAVDELEIRVQTFHSNHKEASKKDTSNLLLGEANELSDYLDSCRADLGGLPEDRVANIIFKSARSKVELLIASFN
mmetsp:Transcript_19325/g.27322  ORF Transcript_19325/g.27322 Transcript_19325/m.27322 type:complete len:295 (+) Transcript_19325:225-1109(+)